MGGVPVRLVRMGLQFSGNLLVEAKENPLVKNIYIVKRVLVPKFKNQIGVVFSIVVIIVGNGIL